MKLRILAALLCLAVAAIVVACGGGDSPVNTAGAPDSASVSPTRATSTTRASGGVTRTPTSEEQAYFQQLALIFNAGQRRSNTASATLDTKLNAAKSLDQQKQAINEFLNTMIAVFQDAAGGMDALNPPAEAKDSHKRFRDDVSKAKDISAGLQGDISAAKTAAEANTIIGDFNTRVNSLVSDSQGACKALQAIANNDGASVNLDCTN